MKSPYAWLESVQGIAECRISGVMPAAFLNRCAAAGIPIREIEAESETEMRLTLPLRFLGRARLLALRSQCELTPLRRSGASVLGRRVLRRLIPTLCLLLFSAILICSKLYIWEIEVQGNETVSDGAIRSALADCGVDIGTFWPDLVSDNLRSELLVKLPSLAWVTVNIHGSRAEVIVRERVPKPELLDMDMPVDLIAKRTGFVTEVRALNGTALVRPGSAVLPGEVLISGSADSAFAGSRETHAIGSVRAETYYELSAAAPATETVRIDTRREKSRWALLIGKKRINFYRNSSFCSPGCDKIINNWECRIEGLFALPFTLVRERIEEYDAVQQPRDFAALVRDLSEQLHAQLLSSLSEGTIEQESYSCSETDGQIVVCLRARCNENIAEELTK